MKFEKKNPLFFTFFFFLSERLKIPASFKVISSRIVYFCSLENYSYCTGSIIRKTIELKWCTFNLMATMMSKLVDCMLVRIGDTFQIDSLSVFNCIVKNNFESFFS